jgi:hypothetical protein
VPVTIVTTYSTTAQSIAPQELSLWKYQCGDSVAWATAEYDDAHWQNLRLPMPFNAFNTLRDSLLSPLPAALHGRSGAVAFENHAADTGCGIFWFRHRFSVDAALRGKELTLVLQSQMPLEVWANGRCVAAFGRPTRQAASEQSPLYFAFAPHYVAVALDSSAECSLAIRCSLGGLGDYYQRYEAFVPIHTQRRTASVLSIRVASGEARVGKALELVESQRSHLTLFAAELALYASLPLVIGLIHLLLFLWYRLDVANAWFALYALCSGYVGWITVRVWTAHQSLEEWTIWIVMIYTTTFTSSFCTLLATYSALRGKFPRTLWLFVGCYGASMALLFLGSLAWMQEQSALVVGAARLLALVASLEAVRQAVITAWHRRDITWILCVGIIAQMGGTLYVQGALITGAAPSELLVRVGTVERTHPADSHVVCVGISYSAATSSS